MIKDKKKVLILIITTSFLCSILYITAFDDRLQLASTENSQIFKPIGKLRTSATYYDFAIDDLSANNWTWAKNQGYCNGSGTSIDPYVIENHNFRITASNYSLAISNSEKYFQIMDCQFKSAEFDVINGTGLYLKNVTNGLIQECSFSYFNTCLSMDQTIDSVLNMLSFENSINGIELNACFNNTFQLIECHRLASKAYNFKNSDQNKIISNDIQQSDDGLFFYNSHHNEVNETTIHMNNGIGIYLNSSNYNTFTQTLSGKNQDGIIMMSSNFNKLLICTGSFNNGSGLKIRSSHENTVKDCIFYNNSLMGIALEELCNNNTIEGNRVELNQNHGISLTSCIDNSVTGNIVKNNQLVGISLFDCSNNRILENTLTISGIEDGIFLLYCINNLVMNNDVRGNVDWDRMQFTFRDGIHIEFGVFNTILQNDISNHLNGIFLNNSALNYLIRNTISNDFQSSSAKGIFLENSNNNYVIENIMLNFAVMDVQNCIVEKNCQDNIILGNQCNQQTDFTLIIFLSTLIPSLGLNIVLLTLFLRKRKLK